MSLSSLSVFLICPSTIQFLSTLSSLSLLAFSFLLMAVLLCICVQQSPVEASLAIMMFHSRQLVFISCRQLSILAQEQAQNSIALRICCSSAWFYSFASISFSLKNPKIRFIPPLTLQASLYTPKARKTRRAGCWLPCKYHKKPKDRIISILLLRIGPVQDISAQNYPLLQRSVSLLRYSFINMNLGRSQLQVLIFPPTPEQDYPQKASPIH